MISGAASLVLPYGDDPCEGDALRSASRDHDTYANVAPWRASHAPLLRIPPFPKASVTSFKPASDANKPDEALVELIRRNRVGGTSWAAQPELPEAHVLVRVLDAAPLAKTVGSGAPAFLWSDLPVRTSMPAAIGDCDPWHMLRGATALVCDAADEVRLIAAILGVPRFLWHSGELIEDHDDAAELLAAGAVANAYHDPFTDQIVDGASVVELCGFWRRLIDQNRDIGGGLGFAFWKQAHVAPLLWGGSSEFRFFNRAVGVDPSKAVAVWRAKSQLPALDALQSAGTPLIEVEDGFLRSRGLGADCIPPLSITVDRLGPHFDPTLPTELELLLEEGDFTQEALRRARELRQIIVDAGLGKYELGGDEIARPAGDRLHVLVPGQVEDDRAVQTGGCGLTSNLELLRRVRAEKPDAYILYKPHPDVVGGHRRGAISQEMALRYADQIVSDQPVSSLLNMVDEVHVNTSLAGFEALLREKRVVTYGVPFYAGWGLTRDLGPVPGRRRARRSLDELVAATLLIYPRYLDPVTGLPCPAEIVVSRLSQSDGDVASLLVGLRRFQGKLMRHLRGLVQ